MKLVRQWLGWYIRRDWRWRDSSVRPTLVLPGRVQKGWYMLTIRMECEQRRCYGLFNGGQARLLISGRRRRRLVRISTPQARFELKALNGRATIAELRLIKQPFWSVKQRLMAKLMSMHPAYPAHRSIDHSIPRLWSDYNQLLNHKHHGLVGYDDWIEQVERPALQGTQPPAAGAVVHFSVWLHGDRRDAQQCNRSINSIKRQLKGNYELLDADLQVDGDDSQTWVVVLQTGDELAPQAMARLAAVIRDSSDAAVVYADEDCISATGRRHHPQFKPAWNPDLLYSDPGYSHAWAIRSDVCVAACATLRDHGEPMSLYGLALEATAQVNGPQIVHIPEVLYHRADQRRETTITHHSDAILAAFMARRGCDVTIRQHSCGGHVIAWPLPSPAPLVSVIVPTRDCGELLRCCLASLAKHDDGRLPMQIIVVDNDSTEPATLAYLEELSEQRNMTVIRRPGAFNYAAFNNEAVEEADGDVIALLNNDIEAIETGWLSVMVAQALRPDIGAVGAKLLYPDNTIQHGGVLLGIGGVAGHAHKYMPAEADGYQRRLQLSHNLSAVTAAALVIEKRKFTDVGGFNSKEFAVNYNDVDLCLRLMEAGYRNLFCPEATLVHHESKSRGLPIEGQPSYQQWQRERLAMQQRWGGVLMADPSYSPHLSLIEEDMSLTIHGQGSTRGRINTIIH